MSYCWSLEYLQVSGLSGLADGAAIVLVGSVGPLPCGDIDLGRWVASVLCRAAPALTWSSKVSNCTVNSCNSPQAA